MKCWQLPRDVDLRPVLSYCWRVAATDRLLLAHRFERNDGTLLYPESLPATERIFGDGILERRRCRRWPGTVSHERDALVVVVEFDQSLVAALSAVGPKLFDWTGWPEPSLPEDLCLYRTGAQWPVLVSVTHERDAWIIAAEKPVDLDTEESPFRPQELYVPPASQGFLA